MTISANTLRILSGLGVEKFKKIFGTGVDVSNPYADSSVIIGPSENPAEVDDNGAIHARIVGAEGFPAQISAFGELLVAEEHTDISIRFGKNQPAFSTKGRFASTGTVTANVGHHTIDSTSGDASIESVSMVQYRSGHPMIYRMTTAETAAAGSFNVGPHDSEEGFFATVDSLGALSSLSIRNGGVDSAVSAYNGEDISGYDLREMTIWIWKYGWLGTYPPTLWIVKGGRLVRVHTFYTDEGRTTTHIRHPSLPCRISATGGAVVNVGSAVGGSIGGSDRDRAKNPCPYSRELTNQTTAATLANFRIPGTDGDGNKVRIKAVLEKLSPYIQANAVGQSGAVDLVIYGGVTLGGTPSWSALRSDIFTEVDTAGTFVSGTELFRKTFGFSDTNQGGANFSAGDIDPVALGLIGWQGDVFAVRFEPAFGGTDSWDAKLTLSISE